MSCIFCQIASGEIPASVTYHDDDVVAFRDLHPQAPTHILIVPRKHIATVNDLQGEDSTLVGKLFLAAKQIANEHGFAEEGYRLVMNTNHDAGQSVFHIHLHLLAGRSLHWPPG